MKTLSHKTHTGEIVTGNRLTAALWSVAKDWKQLAYAIKSDDRYAPHVAEEAKSKYLQDELDTSERIRNGKESGFWLWQRVNEKLTGECVALLPK